MLAIGAGSETTVTALSNVMFYLIMYPDVFTRLRAELGGPAGSHVPFDQLLAPDRLANLDYL
jgi:cytochrome P450